MGLLFGWTLKGTPSILGAYYKYNRVRPTLALSSFPSSTLEIVRHNNREPPRSLHPKEP